MPKRKIVITGGGTGGHVFPALAIAEFLREQGVEILYVGSPTGMEARLVPERGFSFHAISSGAIKNQGVFTIFATLGKLLKGFIWAWRFLGREKPDLVLGVGGYVSAPACLAARFRGIPVYLQEQNSSVGIANRILGLFAKEVFLGFAEAQAAFPFAKTTVTGNPLRPVFFGPEIRPLNPNGKHLLIMGGSQGAMAINRAMVELLPRIRQNFPDIQITHQTGKSDCEMVQNAYRTAGFSNATVVPFITNVAEAYSAASLVIARSGALTVSELIQVGRPVIFVPYPRKGQNDQTANARMVVSAGAAFMVEQGPDFTERLWKTLEKAFVPEKIEELAENYSQLRSANGLVSIANRLDAGLALSRE